MDSGLQLALIVSAAAAMAWGWWIVSVATAPRLGGVAGGRFEEARRQQVRNASSIYWFFEPWLDEIAAYNAAHFNRTVSRLRSDLPGSGNRVDWLPQEYQATKQLEALLLGLVCFLPFATIASFSSAAMVGGAIGFGYYYACIVELHRRAERRRNVIRRRFSSAFDLVALMIDVGAGFQEAVATVAADSRGHPLGEELDRMLKDTEHGQLRAEAMHQFGERLADEDITEMMAGIVEAQKLGVPMAQIMQVQVAQIRQKRVQWAEKTAEEAKVHLVLPAMVIMLACLIIVAAPFLLGALFASQEM